MRKYIALLGTLSVFITALLVSCTSKQQDAAVATPDTISILATTTIIEDVLRQIGGDGFVYSSLMGAGVDPHIYKPTQGDLTKLKKSDAVFYNGLFLEGKMTEILEKMGREKPVIAASTAIDTALLLNETEFDDGYDPHFWFDPSIWEAVASHFANHLIALDSTQKDIIQYNLVNYIQKLKTVDKEIDALVSTIPLERRFVITSHDALNYFARRYNFQVKSLQGRSTAGELGLKDIRDMVEFLTANEIKAIFPENITGSQSLEAVIDGCAKRGHNVTLGEELYSDALGGPESEAPNYFKMLKVNAERIVSALK